MSHRELDQAGVMRKLVVRELRQRAAARQLGVRQVKRLLKAYRQAGAAGLVSKRRGHPSNNRIAVPLREHFAGLVRDRYHDFAPIHATTPQAKGRVERANQTLQDRLVKELRLIFSLHHARRLSKNLTCQFNNRELQLTGHGRGYRLRGARVTLCEHFDGTITLLHTGQALAFRVLAEGATPIPVEDEKSVHRRIDQIKTRQVSRPAYKPAPDHPWKRAYPDRIA